MTAYHKTTITLVVLSEEPISERMDIADIVRETDEGCFVLYSSDLAAETLTGTAMASALVEAGSDPGFFMLGEDYEALLGNAGWGVRNTTTGEFLSDGYDTAADAWQAAGVAP